MKYRDKLERYKLFTGLITLTLIVIAYNEVTKIRNVVSFCTKRQINFQDSFFEVAKVRGCPPEDDRFMRLIQTHLPDATTFVDIGSNKGYTSVRFFHLWDPMSQLTPSSWYKQSDLECGACSDCRETTNSLLTDPCDNPETQFKTSDPNKKHGLLKKGLALCEATKTKINVMAFDGNKNLVTDMVNNIGKWDMGHHKWTVEHAAFTRTCAPGETLRFNPKGELGSISPKGSMSAPCKTVTQVIDDNELDNIDILKIDTEGHDGDVIMGAYSPLHLGKITVLTFEYHSIWPEGKLPIVMDLLDRTAYVCYREGKNYLLRWTGCMSKKASQPSWSNVYCINSRTPDGLALINVFDKHSIAFKSPP